MSARFAICLVSSLSQIATSIAGATSTASCSVSDCKLSYILQRRLQTFLLSDIALICPDPFYDNALCVHVHARVCVIFGVYKPWARLWCDSVPIDRLFCEFPIV